MKIDDGTGSGRQASVNAANELRVFAITETESQAAGEDGFSYNINTGDITSLTAGDATLVYFKNDEEETVVLESFAVGIRGFTGLTDMAVLTMIRNPDGGDIVSDATAVSMNQNRNFGSSKTLSTSTLVYKGKAAGTVTGGDDIGQFYIGNNSRLNPQINFEIPRGSSVAIKVVSDATAGTAYAALILHLKDPNREA